MLRALFVEQCGRALFQSSLLVRILRPAGFNARETYDERRETAQPLEKA
jgi:hypothetical protein